MISTATDLFLNLSPEAVGAGVVLVGNGWIPPKGTWCLYAHARVECQSVQPQNNFRTRLTFHVGVSTRLDRSPFHACLSSLLRPFQRSWKLEHKGARQRRSLRWRVRSDVTHYRWPGFQPLSSFHTACKNDVVRVPLATSLSDAQGLLAGSLDGLRKSHCELSPTCRTPVLFLLLGITSSSASAFG